MHALSAWCYTGWRKRCRHGSRRRAPRDGFTAFFGNRYSTKRDLKTQKVRAVTLFLILEILLFSNVTFADPQIKASLSKQPIVSEIELRGLSRTEAKVIHRELQFSVGSRLTAEDLLASVQHLKNLEIFSSVIPLLELQKNNRVKVIIQISEKWTTIPFLTFSSGGGTRYIASGIYDINVFGKYIELGTQYTNWNNEHGLLGWYINRRLFDKRITLQVVAGSSLRPRTLFTNEAVEQGDFVLSRDEINISLIKEFKLWLKAGIGLEWEKDKIIDANYESSLDAKVANQLDNPPRTENRFATLFFTLGKLNFDNYLVEGKQSSLTAKTSSKRASSDITMNMFRWENTAYWRLPLHANAALRFTLAQTDTDAIQHQFYVGGFEHIRGYFDGQFRSKAYGQVNAEYRIPSYRSSWLVLQHIFFVDTVQVADKISQFSTDQSNYFSAGTGFRIISPKIYRFNGRLDIALLTSGESKSYVSFGAQQFF